jgi:protein tyrosine phosphatase (PTP) superfamily phosphohydrolase (DUF442 family)/cytochrome c556
MPIHPVSLASGPLLLLALACTTSEPGPSRTEPSTAPAGAPAKDVRYALSLPPPMTLEGSAFHAAELIPLTPREPEEYPGLHNVFQLSDDIVSGSEPHGPEALVALREMGIKTILSVDGKEPDALAAAELGMRYVHIPIQYSGFSEGELAEITKTFRELEGPFYVHCFHGKHRGPAAAAVGRVVLDGASRETAIGEMKQYCGTSEKYEGLYREIAITPFPGVEETAGLDYGFDPVRRPEGMVGLMVVMTRAHDNLVELDKRAWALDPEHPDVDALNEATKILQAFENAQDLGQVRAGPDDLRGWMEDSLVESRALVAALREQRAGDAEAAAAASASFKRLKAGCNTCHAAYRD